MNITQTEIIEILDDAIAALGEILDSHRSLTEGFIDDQAVHSAQRNIDRLKTNLDRQKEKLGQAKEAQRRKKELEKSRKVKKESRSAAEVLQIRNEKGRVLGFVRDNGNGTIQIYNAKGQLIARQVNNRTYDRRGVFRGYGAQGLRLLGQEESRCYKN